MSIEGDLDARGENRTINGVIFTISGWPIEWGGRGRKGWTLYGAFEVACVGARPLIHALWWLGSLVIARARAMSKSLIREPGNRA